MRDVLAFAWITVTRHRLRSLLAIAGVGVGVCALTSIMSVERSWQRAVKGFFAPMDLETIEVAVPASTDWREVGFTRGLVDATDVDAIRRHCPEVEAATLVDWVEGVSVEAPGFGADQMPVRAVEADFTSALPDKPMEGRLFTAEEVARQAAVCVLSFPAREFFFDQEPALGRQLRIGSRTLTVVGVIAGNRHLGIANARMGSREVFVPASLARTLLGPERSTDSWRSYFRRRAIFLRSRDPGKTVARVEELMRRRVGGGGTRPFTDSLWESREAALHARTRVTFYSWLAALCALLVSGLGIAAVLFVSVAERTGEIGICRAMGASPARIYAEYLSAAGLIALCGALVGAAAGVPAAAAGVFATQWHTIGRSLENNPLLALQGAPPKFGGLPASICWEAVAVGFVLAMMIALAAALAPASEAAAIDPAKAIAQRHVGQSRSREGLTVLQIALSITVLAVLTSYFGALDREQTAEARKELGQDSVSLSADPVAALQEPVLPQYEAGCQEALARTLSSRSGLAKLRAETPLLVDLAPRISRPYTAARGGAVMDAVAVTFTTAEEFAYEPLLKPEDRARVRREFRDDSAAAVIGPRVREELFGARDPVGRPITVGGRQFTVVAVRPEPPGCSGTVGVFVPVQHYPELAHRAVRSEFWSPSAAVTARARDLRQYQEAAAQLRDAILPRLPRQYRKGMVLSATLPANLKQFVFQQKAVAARGAVGSLAVLLVALIGLTNMLLVSVHAEIREVGVRRAFGATWADVLFHFLSRGVALTMVGAVAGLALGLLACLAIARYGAGVLSAASIFWNGLGVVATILAGTLVSLFPAAVAARVQPVEALRYE
jgi:putative ABC transport system permease protein